MTVTIVCSKSPPLAWTQARKCIIGH